jgi:hypothetical protein
MDKYIIERRARIRLDILLVAPPLRRTEREMNCCRDHALSTKPNFSRQ